MTATRREMAGRVLMVGLPGPSIDDDTGRRLARLAPGGVILFGRNLVSPAQTAALNGELARLLPAPPLLALDQEGGRVSRLAPWIGPTQTAVELVDAGELRTRDFGTATAAALVALGFNVDFAPVVDLCPADATNGIGDRSFGTDPGRAARFAGAFLAGLQGGGVAGCLKHFPGLGDTAVDSHVELPTAGRTREELEADLLPYRRLCAEAATVMVGHGHYPAFDAGAPLPATCSAQIVDGLLRRDVGFAGLVVSDDLEMGAVAPRDVDGAAAVEALSAGCDLLLYCAELDRAERAAAALTRAAERDTAFEQRLSTAAARVVETARRWPPAPPAAACWDDACAALEEFAPL